MSIAKEKKKGFVRKNISDRAAGSEEIELKENVAVDKAEENSLNNSRPIPICTLY